MKLKKISEDHYIVVDDSEIKKGDWYYLPRTNSVYQCKEDPTELNLERRWGVAKITHSTQPLGFLNEHGFTTANLKPDWTNVEYLSLSEVKELLGVVDVEKKANKQWGNVHRTGVLGYIEGYNQALEDNKYRKYTNEDMLTIRNQLVAFLLIGDVTALDKIQTISKYTKWFDECVESLQPKTEWEVEIVDGKLKLKQ